ncbi:hypothetical protein CHS0354_009627, partial [Potamilus streckersoni]
MPLAPVTVQGYGLKTQQLECKDIKRKSASFQNHSNENRSIRKHVAEIVPLKTFTQNTMRKQIGTCVNNKGILPRSKVLYTKENRKEELFARQNRDHNDSVSRDDHSTGAQSQELNNSPKNNLQQI